MSFSVERVEKRVGGKIREGFLMIMSLIDFVGRLTGLYVKKV